MPAKKATKKAPAKKPAKKAAKKAVKKREATERQSSKIAKAEVRNYGRITPFEWNQQRSDAAMLMAQGYSCRQVAEEIGASEKTLTNWRAEIEFSAEVDRLSLMVGIAGRAERLRLAQRIARQRTTSDIIESDKDLLDWLKFAQSETDGAKLDLAALLEAATSVAEKRSTGAGDEKPSYIN